MAAFGPETSWVLTILPIWWTWKIPLPRDFWSRIFWLLDGWNCWNLESSNFFWDVDANFVVNIFLNIVTMKCSSIHFKLCCSNVTMKCSKFQNVIYFIIATIVTYTNCHDKTSKCWIRNNRNDRWVGSPTSNGKFPCPKKGTFETTAEIVFQTQGNLFITEIPPAPGPKRKRSFSNHPFSGAIAVSFRCCISLTPIYQKVYSYFCSKLMFMNLEKFHHAGHVLVTFWTSWIVSMSQWPRWRTTSWEFLGCFCCRCVGQKKLDAWGEVIDMICWGDTVDGRNPANQLISSLSHYIFRRSFLHPRWCRISEPSIVW